VQIVILVGMQNLQIHLLKKVVVEVAREIKDVEVANRATDLMIKDKLAQLQ
jgi:hypothetical protein